MFVFRSIEAFSYNRCCSGKAKSITYSDCASVALDIQEALRVRHIASCLTVQYFFTLFHKGKIFRKKHILSVCL